MQVTMQGDFQTGFDGVKDANGVVTPALTNIQEIELINNSNAARQFNALNAGDVKVWELNNNTDGISSNSSTSITNLGAPGVTVNIHDQARGGASILFVKSAVTGANDSLTIGLDRIGIIETPRQDEVAVNLITDDVENITLNTTGVQENIVNLKQMADLQNLIITGDQDLTVVSSIPGQATDAVPASLKTIDGSAATGDLDIQASSATTLLNSVNLGSGDDLLRVNDINSLATIHGGAGNDELRFTNPNAQPSQYALTMDGVETLTLQNVAATRPLSFDGTNIQGLQTLNVDNVANDSPIVLDKYTVDHLNVNVKGSNTNPSITANGPDDIDLNIGTADAAVTYGQSTNTALFTANEATSLTVNLANKASTFFANIDAENVEDFTIQSTDDAASNFFMWAGAFATPNDLSSVNNLIIRGNANVAIGFANAPRYGETIGEDSPELFVDASGGTGNVGIMFLGDDNNSGTNQVAALTQTLNVRGTLTGNNYYAVNNEYVNITINTGNGTDWVDLSMYTQDDLVWVRDHGSLYIDLGDGADYILARNENCAAILNDLAAQGNILNATIEAVTTPDALFASTNVDGSTVSVVGQAGSLATWSFDA